MDKLRNIIMLDHINKNKKKILLLKEESNCLKKKLRIQYIYIRTLNIRIHLFSSLAKKKKFECIYPLTFSVLVLCVCKFFVYCLSKKKNCIFVKKVF